MKKYLELTVVSSQEGREVFGGLAHWIKGGIFFWLGLFTLGRWAGSFGELGWAWNVRPRKEGKWRPSAEFVESFLIFFYGSTNIFLEHLGGWGGKWSPQDLEHVSITVLFIGGGLVSEDKPNSIFVPWLTLSFSSVACLLSQPVSEIFST